MTRYELVRFSAAGAERATGVSTMQQRNWRKYGFLPPVEAGANASFTLTSLSELLAIQLLAARGIGPAAAQAMVRDAGRGIAFFALGWIDAYAGLARHPEPSLSWGETAAVHRVKLLGEDGRLPLPLRFLSWWADDSYEFTASLDHSFDAVTSSHPKVASGAVVVIDLAAAASGLLARAGVPLVRVDWADPVPGFSQPGPSLPECAGLLSAF